MNRVIFLIDGFNLYHSVKHAERELKASTKWLDIKGLCSSYLHLISHAVGAKTTLVKIHYFSALAVHLEAKNPDVTARHKTFIRCLKDNGIDVELSRFKWKKIECPFCHRQINRHEEKETDVAIALKLLEIFIHNECDTAVLMTGDTDLAPAVKTANRLFPDKQVIFSFPYKRKNKELEQLAPGSFMISKKQYVKHQFPDPYILSGGISVHKPASW